MLYIGPSNLKSVSHAGMHGKQQNGMIATRKNKQHFAPISVHSTFS